MRSKRKAVMRESAYNLAALGLADHRRGQARAFLTVTAPLLITEQEAAERLRICARQLRKARQEGRLHYLLNGRRIRYTIEDLESFVDSLRQVQSQCQPAPSSHRSTRRRQGDGQVIPFKARQRGG